MKLLMTLFLALFSVTGKAQSIHIHSWDCNGYEVGALQTGYYEITVAYSATVPSAGFELISYKNGGDAEIHDTLQENVSMGIITITHIPADTGLGYVNYNLNLQIRRGGVVVVSNVVNVDGLANPNPVDSLCYPLALVNGTEDQEIPGNLLYPNPTTDIVNVGMGGEYFVTNTLGQTVLAGVSNENRSSISLGHLSSGYYTIHLNQRVIGRVLKQ